ncbi:MAG TPA: RMD1 family protein, partial [Bacillota bacterium]|nr:RMD1 family protein [Bacillota bacterium]
ITDYHENSDYLLLKPEHIQSILRVESAAKYGWLFRLGSICLVNFDTTETHKLLKHLEATGVKTDFALFSTFNEQHQVEYDYDDPAHFEQVLELNAIVMAKSIELRRLETLADTIVDGSERFILDLQKGFSNPNSSGFIHTHAAIIKLQLEIINNLKLLDRPSVCGYELFCKEVYSTAALDFELERRFEILQQKMTNLNEVLEPYRKLGFVHKEQQLYLMEIILLALFPVFHVIHFILDRFF